MPMSWARKDSGQGKKAQQPIIGGRPGHTPSRAEQAQQALFQGDIIIRTEHAARRPGPAQTARRALAVSMGRAARSGIRRLGQGNGSAVPGAVALAIDPGALAGLAERIPDGAVLVTGSNGKGTTCRMLAQVLQAAGLHPIANHEGSNQLAGVTTALLAGTGAARRAGAGQPAGAPAIGLLEVDEGSCPVVFPQIARPGAVVVTNLFRDQLDRYLEPEYVRSLLEGALRSLPASTTLVLNADDPRLAHLAPELPNPRLYFGVADTAQGRAGADPTSDSPRCPRCAGELSYSCVLYAHLGHWSCAGCGLARPAPDVEVSKIDLLGPGSSGSSSRRRTPRSSWTFRCPGCTTPTTRWLPQRPPRPSGCPPRRSRRSSESPPGACGWSGSRYRATTSTWPWPRTPTATPRCSARWPATASRAGCCSA
jgi:hypothetical protein